MIILELLIVALLAYHMIDWLLYDKKEKND
jgi:hypothetical protein